MSKHPIEQMCFVLLHAFEINTQSSPLKQCDDIVTQSVFSEILTIDTAYSRNPL